MAFPEFEAEMLSSTVVCFALCNLIDTLVSKCKGIHLLLSEGIRPQKFLLSTLG